MAWWLCERFAWNMRCRRRAIRSLSQMSHGESFLEVARDWFSEPRLFVLGDEGLTGQAYDDLEVVQLWRNFLDAPQRFLHHLG
jgi:predicted ATPase